ncbi:MAG: hypothetical protein AB7I12_03845 [Steroidobacteraceae bacterium]
MDKHGTLRSTHGFALSEAQPKPLIPPLGEINLRCIELLVSAARLQGHDHDATNLVGALHDRLVTLTTQAQQKMACYPFILVDLKFQDRQWWQTLIGHPHQAVRHAIWRRYFAKSTAIKLTRATLMLAWHSAQTHPELATVTLGMDLQLTALIGSLSLHQLDQIAEHQHPHLVPRWEDRPIVWKHLLDHAGNADLDADDDFTLHGLQLTVGEHLDSHPQRPATAKRVR